MLQLDFLQNSWFFKEFHLQANEILFDEWEKDQNIYIIVTGEIEIQKYTTLKRDEVKTLAKLSADQVFWEAALNNNKPKEARVIATRKTLLLWINAQEWIQNFMEKYPIEATNFLKYIIHLATTRVNYWNSLITANYKITQEIQKIKKVTNKSIFELIDKLEKIIHIDYILFVEKNPVMKDFLMLKYDSRNKWQMSDKIIEVANSKLDFLELKINDTYSQTMDLNIWPENLWYLIFVRKNEDFSDNDIKILASISTWISWLIKEKRILEEEKNRIYMQN